jgi:hypothetical protein
MMERVNTGTGATDMSEIYRIIPTLIEADSPGDSHLS